MSGGEKNKEKEKLKVKNQEHDINYDMEKIQVKCKYLEKAIKLMEKE